MIKRHISALVKRSLQDFPAVLINGARQVGKSTLAQQLSDAGVVNAYITLDDLSNLEAARYDPDGFLSQFSGTVAIDEIQMAPDLLRALKKNIDSNRKPGRFLLTGSANILSYPGVTESLAGRMDIIQIEGLSAGELLGEKSPSDFVSDLFKGIETNELVQKWNRALGNKPQLNKELLCSLINFGGFPEVAIKKQDYFKNRWFGAYQSAYIERDVRGLSHLLDIVPFSKIFRLLGLQTGNLLNYNNLASEAQLDQRTVARYLEILEVTFQCNLLRPWFSNTRKRLIKTPKVYMNDSGQACYLAGVQTNNISANPFLGFLLETWVWSELRKLLIFEPGIESFFYRTHLGKEVDFLLAKGSTYWGIECKFAESLTQEDFSGLKDLMAVIGDNCKGIVLYRGNRVIAFAENLLAVPFSCLL